MACWHVQARDGQHVNIKADRCECDELGLRFFVKESVDPIAWFSVWNHFSKSSVAEDTKNKQAGTPLANLRSHKAQQGIADLVSVLDDRVEGHESGECPLVDIVYEDYKHDLELLEGLR